MAKGEIHPEVNADEIASIMTATLEGAIMMSKLCGDSVYMPRTVKHLNQYIETHFKIRRQNFFYSITNRLV
ncbi:TetR family transcriptional regulator C-terminal domain-containing protein [Anabaena sp. CA = ATCC 33047]|uniref:TetR family transcriptional regulator C-terminal domain-containing protein n=1 Tax=Anabaena sp. (strain CA / ATCC 33047) TaxID=52271 RepID=UPI00403F6E3D